MVSSYGFQLWFLVILKPWGGLVGAHEGPRVIFNDPQGPIKKYPQAPRGYFFNPAGPRVNF